MDSIGYIKLTFVFREEDGQITAQCEELGTATCGESYEEAKKNIFEAVQVHLDGLEEFGERAQFFHERGIQVLSVPQHTASVPVSEEALTTIHNFPVPTDRSLAYA